MDLGRLTTHELPAGALALIGLFLLYMVFKMGEFFFKTLLFLAAVGALGGAIWWHLHR